MRSTPIESNHPSRRPGDLPGTHRQAAPPVPCPAAPLSGGLLPPDSHPPGPDNLLPPAPVGAISICKGFWYCGSNGKLVSQHAIDGWKNFVFYRPGTAVVASYDDNARITILHCPSGYSGPGLIGKQIKDTLQFVLDRCPSKACGSKFLPNSNCFVTLDFRADCVPTNPAGGEKLPVKVKTSLQGVAFSRLTLP